LRDGGRICHLPKDGPFGDYFVGSRAGLHGHSEQELFGHVPFCREEGSDGWLATQTGELPSWAIVLTQVDLE